MIKRIFQVKFKIFYVKKTGSDLFLKIIAEDDIFIHDFKVNFSSIILMTFCSSFDMAASSQQAAVTESLNASQDKYMIKALLEVYFC